MRVVFLSMDLFSRGGIPRYSRYELRALHRLLGTGELKVCSLAGPGLDRAEDAPHVDLVGAGISRAAKLRFAFSVLRLASRHKAQLIICDHVNLSPIAYAYRMLTSTPYWLNVYAIEVWRRLPRLRRRGLIRADRVVSDCQFTKEFLERRYPTMAGRLRLIADCVDSEQFVPAAKDLRLQRQFSLDGHFVLLTVSRLPPGRSKGHQKVMEALASLGEASARVKYLVVGDGADRSRLEGIARQLGLADRVMFAGSLADQELPAVYRLCDAFVLVSGFALDDKAPQGEGVPLVVLEAAACGRPAIVSRKDGSAESVVDGVTGLLVDPNDSRAIAEAVKRLMGGVEFRLGMGAAARQYAEKAFSYETFATKVGALLTEFERFIKSVPQRWESAPR